MKDESMSMLKKATNKMAYGKIGLYGEQGSGKSRTAAEIAIGICKAYGLDKPMGIFDTEPAWSTFLVPLIEKAGLPTPYVYDESRAFKDLLAWTREAKEACSVLIVDSITHVWRDLQMSCLARINETRVDYGKRPLAKLEFQHWDPIKRQWAEFTDEYLSSRVHFIICGRAGSIYEYQENDNGKRELITVGTKMATEKEAGYEPSLLIEMIKDRQDGKIINTALVEKDRSDKLNGKLIPMPNFQKLKPHFDSLNIGGQHFGSMQQRDSRELFNEAGEDTTGAELRRKEVALDEIQQEMLRHHGHGQDAGTKAAKAATLEQITTGALPQGTRSWAKLESLRLDTVIQVRNKLWLLTRGHEYGAAPPPAEAEKIEGDESIPQEPKQEAAA
jgi:hypothetical protein